MAVDASKSPYLIHGPNKNGYLASWPIGNKRCEMGQDGKRQYREGDSKTGGTEETQINASPDSQDKKEEVPRATGQVDIIMSNKVVRYY